MTSFQYLLSHIPYLPVGVRCVHLRLTDRRVVFSSNLLADFAKATRPRFSHPSTAASLEGTLQTSDREAPLYGPHIRSTGLLPADLDHNALSAPDPAFSTPDSSSQLIPSRSRLKEYIAKQFTHVATSVCRECLLARRGPDLARKEIRGLSEFGPASIHQPNQPRACLGKSYHKTGANEKTTQTQNSGRSTSPHPRQRPQACTRAHLARRDSHSGRHLVL